MLFVSAGPFGTFLFLTYCLQQTLGYSPLVTGVAFLPLSRGRSASGGSDAIDLGVPVTKIR
jgi:hypothetical protein